MKKNVLGLVVGLLGLLTVACNPQPEGVQYAKDSGPLCRHGDRYEAE